MTDGNESKPAGGAAAGVSEGRIEEKRGIVREMAGRTTPPEAPRGYIDSRLVRAFMFIFTVISLILGVVVSILGIWDYLTPEIVGRTLGTIGVVYLAILIFWLANDVLGGSS